MSELKRILRDLTREIDRLFERNVVLERRLESINGALQAPLRSRSLVVGRTVHVGPRSTRRRRGAPLKFSQAQARQLRAEYERGSTSAQLARKYKAALPTILSTLRRAGTTLRRGRPSKSSNVNSVQRTDRGARRSR